ncbi:glycoside hydrolase family 15 protein [Streptomyces virginiae]|uniref:glycoside hydrolase family 15 protein n=1 Tax=Streptomyces virginiae TaxID=1961 RepID=UPI0036B7C2AF
MDAYPAIADHGMVGDLQTAALVSSQGTVDWWCTPRFDSPSVFASLLDSERGGYCRLAADLAHDPGAVVRQLYQADTAVLVTRYMGPGGVGEVADFMVPLNTETATQRHRLVRVVRVVRGSLDFELECRPRFDYGRAPHTFEQTDGTTVVFRGPGTRLHLQAAGVSGPLALRRDGDDATARFTLTAGNVAAVVLTSDADDAPAPPPLSAEAISAELQACRTFWHAWLRSCTYRGRWRDIVHRSAITLKLLTYAPTGAPIAALTMGLPEQVGGERNWDYRFTWVRDASLSVKALIDLGFVEEAAAFRRWLLDRLAAGGTASGEPLQIMYRIDGEPHLTEVVLDHLEGYAGSRPVRAGNAAADQIQLDIWGIHLASTFARPADIDRWREVRDTVFAQIVERGWNADKQAFVQHYATDVLDASLLLMPRVGFVSPVDPLWLSTLDAMDRELVSDSLVYRYNPEASPDGLRGSEGTFNLCSFLYVEALARAGKPQQARYAFDKMLTYANHVGLFAEEIGPSGEQLGNFPQAFTHLALIAAALALDEQLDRTEGSGADG